jgi:hypothetical protein
VLGFAASSVMTESPAVTQDVVLVSALKRGRRRLTNPVLVDRETEVTNTQQAHLPSPSVQSPRHTVHRKIK